MRVTVLFENEIPYFPAYEMIGALNYPFYKYFTIIFTLNINILIMFSLEVIQGLYIIWTVLAILVRF